MSHLGASQLRQAMRRGADAHGAQLALGDQLKDGFGVALGGGGEDGLLDGQLGRGDPACHGEHIGEVNGELFEFSPGLCC